MLQASKMVVEIRLEPLALTQSRDEGIFPMPRACYCPSSRLLLTDSWSRSGRSGLANHDSLVSLRLPNDRLPGLQNLSLNL